MLDQFHPVVAAWFRDTFGHPTEPQVQGWPHIAAGEDTLIAAPTGSGKTLAAFLACLDRLIRRSLPDAPGKNEPAGLPAPAGLPTGLDDRTYILYVSPLKALSNDIHRNLETPLAQLEAAFARQGLVLPPIRAAVRTGDTPASERSKMARRPPHILVTTPESLFILLTSKSGRAGLAGVETVIVDEIHAVAGSKRGAHLSLSLERLDRLVRAERGTAPVRVGLSATQRPIEMIARMLGGTSRPLPHIVDGGHARHIDMAIELTDDVLGAVASHEQMGRVYDRIAALVAEHRTTLVFVNTRRLVERVAHQLEERLGEDQIVAHHGSMSRELRFTAEQKLKSGHVRCAVATASLELGIDVGSVDLVVQIGSPRSIATMLQRVGRSGHSLGATPKGRLFALTRDQLVECASLVRALHHRNLDAIEPRMQPLDILAQQIVATAACEDLDEDEVLALAQGSFHYQDLTRDALDKVLLMLAEGTSDRRGRATAHLHWDRINGRIKARRGARLAALTSGGAIPDNANYQVVLYPEEVRVGEVDEDFAIDSSAGDVFLLGNSPWRIRRVEAGRVIVEDARGATPTVPFWFGEAPARTVELSDEVSSLRNQVEERLRAGESQGDIAAWLGQEASMSQDAAAQLVAYLAEGLDALGALPTRTTLIAERFFDDGGGMQLIIHAPLGGRINRAWGLALRKRFCRGFDFELQAAATDDGIVISLGQPHSFPLETVFQFLSSATVEEILVQALLDSPMFEIRWRWNTTRALAVLRRTSGKKVAPHILRMRANDLLSVVFPQQQACLENIAGDREVPDHPLVTETVRDCLTEAMDIERLRAVIAGIEDGKIRVLARDTVAPSPLCHELVSANPYAFLDDAGLEDRRTRAVSLRPVLPAGSAVALDAAAIATAEDEARPAVRDADELHDALLSLYLLPEDIARRMGTWDAWMDDLVRAGRATRLSWNMEQTYVAWVAAERLPLARVAVPGATPMPALPPLPFAVEVPEVEAADMKIVGAHLDASGPRAGRALAAELGLPPDRVMAALFALENDGAILRGRFTEAAAEATAGSADRATSDIDIEWCNRRILARIHRLTLDRLRRQIEPVSAAALMRFLFRWQRVTRESRLIGAEGLLEVVEQLQGFESAAGAWEREVLPARLHGYEPAWLDTLCLSGQVAWCRLSARRSASGRSAPTKAAPLAILLRRDLDWLRAPASRAAVDAPASPDDAASKDAGSLGDAARAVHDCLARGGASFLAELVSRTGLSPDQVEDGLWELVAAGLATADGFASLRVLVDRERGEVRSVFDAAGARKGRPEAPRTRAWQQAIQKARRRERQRPAHAVRSLPTAAGRWSLLGPLDASAMDAEATARQLLGRYGVVFRDLLVREPCLPPWRDILIALRRLEARGEVRGGRFVAGFAGEQFALPEAVDGLRAVRQPPPVAELVRVAATDPLNLAGITSDGAKVPAVMNNAVLYRDGVPLASLEAGEVVLRQDLEEGARVDADLAYFPPPRRDRAASAQASLPLL